MCIAKRFSVRYRIMVAALFLMVVSVMPLSAYSRLSIGGSWAGMALQGTIAGPDYGTLVSKTNGFNVTVEGEIIPIEQWSIILRGQVNAFTPKIVSGGEKQPQDPNAVVPFTMTGRFGVATGWQLPFSDWTLTDFPLDLTIGLGATLNLLHLAYDTPMIHYSASEIALGAGAYLSLSWYFSPLFGLSFSTMPSVTVLDWTTSTTTATGGAADRKDLLTYTPLKFSWDATLAATIRFGW